MRNMNCRNIRREIEEAGPGDLLSSGVNDHVLSCIACATLLREETKLRELVSSLGTVEAPGDFDFRLRARLAGEKRAVSFAFGNFSFGFRSAAVVTVLLLIGSALMFVSFRTRSDTPQTVGVTEAGTDKKGSNPVVPKETVATNGPETLGGSQVDKGGAVNANVNSPEAPAHPPAKRHGLNRPELASLPGSSQATRDSGSTRAAVIKGDQLAEVYRTSAFPIDAGYQSLKVSVDDGRGSSRTISLPTVSFGSQRSLSQSGSPLMASSRGAW
jgi:hypothetical protein